MFLHFFKKKKQVKVSHPAIERARLIAFWMDSAFTIPIIRKKIGLDPLLGLLPIGGDLISALFSLYIIYVALELGLPGHVLVRMGLNVAIDLGIGIIPVIGDITDAWIKSNQWNLNILEEAYQCYGVTTPPIHPGFQTLDIQAEPA